MDKSWVEKVQGMYWWVIDLMKAHPHITLGALILAIIF